MVLASSGCKPQVLNWSCTREVGSRWCNSHFIDVGCSPIFALFVNDSETSEEDGWDKAVDNKYVVLWFVSDISLFDRIRSCTVGS